MKFRRYFVVVLVVPLLSWANGTEDQKAAAAVQALDWHIGPSVEQVGNKATLRIAEKTLFLDEKNSTQFLQITGNLPTPGNNIVVSNVGGWWADFAFNPIGYVKDDERINADELLKNLRDADGPANKERQRLGLRPVYTTGWHIPPHYDAQTKRLEWGLKLISDGNSSLNYTIRLLGRTGVMSATLVSSPETLDADVVSFKKMLQGFEFNSGERYSEFKEGDHVAEYGLAALIVGGAAAVATKKGFWAVLGGFLAAGWKIIAAVVVAFLAWFKGLLRKKKES